MKHYDPKLLKQFHKNFVEAYSGNRENVLRVGLIDSGSFLLIHDTPLSDVYPEGSLGDNMGTAHAAGMEFLAGWEDSRKLYPDSEMIAMSCVMPAKVVFNVSADCRDAHSQWDTRAFITSGIEFCIMEMVELGVELTHVVKTRDPFWFEGKKDDRITVSPTFPMITHLPGIYTN